MQSEEYENDSDTTYCSAAEDASLVESDLPSLFTTIHDKIQLHIKKQEFFNKSSVEYYLNVLSTIDNQDSLVKLAIEESSKKLQSILRSINKYEEVIRSGNSSVI